MKETQDKKSDKVDPKTQENEEKKGPPIKPSNLVMLFSTKPGEGVAADTKFARDFTSMMKNFSSYEDDTIRLPDLFKFIDCKDA